MIFTSGSNQRPSLTQSVYRFMLNEEPLLSSATITIHTRRLKSENVVGWQQQEDTDEFLIDVERTLSKSKFILTLMHELVHCRQSLEGLMNDEEREEEAYHLEKVYFDKFSV